MSPGDRCSLAAMPVWLAAALIALGVLALEHLTGRNR